MTRRFGRDVTVYAGTDLLFRLAQFALVPLYTHVLSLAQFGVLALLIVSTNLLGSLVSLGVGIAVQRFYFDTAIAEADRPRVIGAGLAQLLVTGSLVVATVLLAAYPLRDVLLTRYAIAWPLVVLTAVTVLPDQIAQFALDATRLKFAPYRFALIAVIRNLAGLALGAWLLVAWGMGLTGLLIGPFASALVAALLGVWLIRRDIAWTFDRALIARIFAFGYPFVFTNAAYWLFGSLDRWMLIEMSDANEVGLFSIALRFATVMTFVITAFATAWIPYALKMARDDAGYRGVYAKLFSAWFLFLAVLALALSLFAPEVLRLLTPRPYWPAAPILSMAAAGMALYGTTQFTLLGMTIEKRTRLISLCAWITAGANATINLALIPALGALGSAIATMLSYAVLTGSYLLFSQRLHPLPLEVGKLTYCLVIVVAAAMAPWLTPDDFLGAGAVMGKLALVAAAVAGGLAFGIAASARDAATLVGRTAT